MANPTTNYGWVMPTATDLVTDLPADFAVFGQAVDTSMADLKGGTTGQILAKATNTDMDFTWVTTDDTNAIQNAIVDAKGDLITATAADTPARLAVGATNGMTLQVDSTTATGLKWATPASGSTFSGALALRTADGAVSNATFASLSFNTETNGYDTDGYHDTSTNNTRMTIPTGKSGYFWVWFNVTWEPNATGRRIARIMKNGTTSVFSLEVTPNATGEVGISAGKAFSAVATDYFEIEVYQSSGGNLSVLGSQIYNTQFGVYYLGA
jgi:hypothetical protein